MGYGSRKENCCYRKSKCNNIRQALIALLKYCKNMGLIDVSNESKIKLPDIRKGRRDREKIVNIISQTEYEKVYFHMDACESMYAEIIRFLRETGLRAEELAIKPADINGKTLNVRRVIKRQPFEVKDVNGKVSYKSKLVASNYMKSKAAYRSIPLSKKAMQAIKCFENWKKENHISSEYIFCTKTGGLSEQRNILRAFHSACESVGVEKRGLHSLRKLFCKTLRKLPTDWEKVRRIMGHTSVKVTINYYYALNNDDIEDIADSLSVDQ
ncbi:MAG: tyrosine-type recombinase/integrase [Clostridiales bacterium]|nr:tyrosine-type recombinase/integrase [Clostridiales bacterium]